MNKKDIEKKRKELEKEFEKYEKEDFFDESKYVFTKLDIFKYRFLHNFILTTFTLSFFIVIISGIIFFNKGSSKVFSTDYEGNIKPLKINKR